MKEIPRETLKNLYIEKRKTQYGIAQMIGVDQTVISSLLKKYNIDHNPKSRKFELIKKVPFTQDQKDLVVGIILGNGRISWHGKNHKSAKLTVEHKDNKKDFLMWKKSILANFVNNINVDSDLYSFTTCTHDQFVFYRKLFYEANKKVIREDLITHLKPLSLASWFLDRGSFNNNISMRLSTHMFTKEENELLQWMLKYNFDVRSKVCEYEKNSKKYYYLSFNKENSLKMNEIIVPFANDSRQYKLLIPND